MKETFHRFVVDEGKGITTIHHSILWLILYIMSRWTRQLQQVQRIFTQGSRCQVFMLFWVVWVMARRQCVAWLQRSRSNDISRYICNIFVYIFALALQIMQSDESGTIYKWSNNSLHARVARHNHRRDVCECNPLYLSHFHTLQWRHTSV